MGHIPGVFLVAMGMAAVAALALTWRWGLKGALASVALAVLLVIGLALIASYLVGRLEGGRAAEWDGILGGLWLVSLRVGLHAGPAVLLGVAAGALLRLSRRKPKPD